MTIIIMALIFGVLGGVAVALAFQSPANCRLHAERRQRYEDGKGPNPDDDQFGPHRGFRRNALTFGLFFAVIGGILGAFVIE